MGRYRLRALVVGFILSLVTCMLVISVSDIRNSSNYTKPNSEMGLPGSYYRIVSEISGTGEELSENTIFESFFQILSEDEDVIGIFQCNNMYLYDPSGYYNTQDISGSYFSRGDFESGREKGVLIYENSAYSLMEDEGRVYCFGEYRDVIGKYSQQHPLYQWSGSNVVQCLSPDIMLTDTSPSVSIQRQAQIYLANCDGAMFNKVKEALTYTGWTVMEAHSMKAFVPEKPDLAYTLRYLCLDSVMPVLLSFVLGAVALCRLCYVAIRKDGLMKRSVIQGLVLALAGCLIGNAGAAVYRWISSGQIMWTEALASVAIGTGLVLFLMTVVWISMVINRKASTLAIKGILGKLLRAVKRVGVPVMAVVLTCLTISFVYGGISQAVGIIKGALEQKKMDYVQEVRFSIFQRSTTVEAQQEVDKIVVKAMNEGKAFSIIDEGNSSILVVGSKALKDTYKLKWIQETPAACIGKDNKRIKKGDTVSVVIAGNVIEAPVVEVLSKNTNLRLGRVATLSLNDRAIVILDAEDCMQSGALSSKALYEIYFVNADSSLLTEYAMGLDKTGAEYYLEYPGENIYSYYLSDLPQAVFEAICMALLAILLFMFLAVAIGITAEGKEIEVRVLMLYGAGLKGIWPRMLPLAAEIMVPVGVIVGALWRFRQMFLYGMSVLSSSFKPIGLYYYPVSSLFQMNHQIRLRDMISLEYVARGMAAGLIASALVGVLLARRLMDRDSSQ